MPPPHAWRRLRLPALAVAAVVLAFVAGFGLFINSVRLLSPPAEPPAADAIIVLTGGQSRLGVAFDLLKSGKGKRLLISGVSPLAGRTSLTRALGGDKTLFSCCVDIDREALDTIGNAEESAKWVRQHGYASIILVTNDYHMPRSLLEMRRLLTGAEVYPYPVVNAGPPDRFWLTRPAVLRVLFTEYAKYLAALARGILPGRPAESPVTVSKAES